MNELALFAGAGGGILGGKLLGWKTVCAVEFDPYAASVLAQRQNDGILDPFPIWDDVCTFDGGPWQGNIDIISGGFPCQDISAAGSGEGITGKRSGLWSEMARIVCEVRPRFVYVENSPMLVGRGLAVVISDLAEMGYVVEWGIVGAHHVAAPHKRDRIWILAHANSLAGREQQQFKISKGKRSRHKSDRRGSQPSMADTNSKRKQQPEGVEQKVRGRACNSSEELADTSSIGCSRSRKFINAGNQAKNRERQAGQPINVCQYREWPIEPSVGRLADGVAARVDRLKALGNGQVPRVAATAFNILYGPGPDN